jgi:hypothetical protein
MAEVEEGAFNGGRLIEQQRPLPEVVEHQRRHDEAKPGEADRRAAKVAHVGIQRFAAGHRQNDGTEGEESQPRMGADETDGIERIEGKQNSGVLGNFERAENTENGEPADHDRTEQLADSAGAMALDEEQPGKYDEGNRDDVGLERRGDDLQAFDCREYGDCRRDHAVAVEQGGGEDAEQGNDPGQARTLGFLGHQRQQRQRTALTPIVGAHDDQHVLDRNQHHDRPEHQRQDAENVFGRYRDRMVAIEDFLQGIQRTGTDVAEDNTDGGDSERRHGFTRVHVFSLSLWLSPASNDCGPL